ncbi:MAG: class I mannose-6-phosphate isomerase, partial [Myxococcota bacterium]
MSDSVRPRNLQAQVLQRDNFTPLARTPWAGDRIVSRYKPELAARPVGESWEFSLGPEFASTVQGGATLRGLVESDADAWLGTGSPALLVKLLDTATPLSVQIHPEDTDPALAPSESGKPESWYVTHADEGAGIYLGFQDGVGEADARRAAAGNGFDALMNYVPCKPHDFFVIPARTPHAIGAGLTLVEPQRVALGTRGVTYRYWDWNRRYDQAGRPDPKGKPRELHLERALAVTRWDLGTGALRKHASLGAPTAQLQCLAGPGGALESDDLRVWRLAGDGRGELRHRQLRALTVLEGSVQVGDVVVRAGSTAA